MAAIQMPKIKGRRGRWRLSGKLDGPEAMKPAVKSRASPGRKKPTNRPDSAKTIAQIPRSPKVSMRCSASSQSGSRASTGRGYRHPPRAVRSGRLVPLRPADPRPPVGRLEPAQRTGEPGDARAVGPVVDEVDRAEVPRLHGQLERTARDLAARGEPVRAELLAGSAHVDLLHRTARRED